MIDDAPFGPPAIPTLVRCLHCGEEYDSWRIEQRPHPQFDHDPWFCPTTGCDGLGFLFDIYPVDPDWRDENGDLVWIEDEPINLD